MELFSFSALLAVSVILGNAVANEAGWSDWSEWSLCSRTCDGGVSYQKRICHRGNCRGTSVRYRICNIEPCTESGDFRDEQCASYNRDDDEGQRKRWKSYYHPDETCALYCVNQYEDIQRLKQKVHDGTRCRPAGSLDMCIDGKCMPVGCDLEIESLKTLDDCGVCGGNGKSCTQPLYQWNHSTNTTCSVKCGGGYKVSKPVCQDIARGEIVEESLCDLSQMPEGKLLECNLQPCPPRWEASEWSSCSQMCGSGIKTRRLYCVEEHNKTKTKVFNHMCKGHRPRIQESCNMQPCPVEWVTGSWTKCSVTCGTGIQTRNVTCPSSDLSKCDYDKKPPQEQICHADIPCRDENFYASSEEASREAEIQAEKLVGKQTGSPHAVFVAEEWGPCSATCGEGIRKRKVYCKAHLDYTKIMTKISDDTCSGEKPAEIEHCVNKACVQDAWDSSVQDGFSDANADSISPKVAPGSYGKTYSWKKNGFTPCTATCLGGVQELIVNCVRNEDQKVVSPYLCDSKSQPPVITQTCNDHPCPPRWNISEYSPCTKSCGMGLQIREVNCIHEVTLSNTVVVPNYLCEQPPPPDRQHCNFVDCPVEWHVSNWTKCSKSCGGGVKKRTVRCQQVTAQNHVVSHPEQMCNSPKPQDTRPCNGKPCASGEEEEPIVVSENQSYNQQDTRNTEVSIKIGGYAYIFEGMRVRIRCPVKKLSRGKITWTKNGKELENSDSYKISRKGILRITELKASDNTTFSCIAGRSSGSLKIIVKQKPMGFPPSSEEYDKNNQFNPAYTMEFSGHKEFEMPEYDISHERLPDGSRSYYKKSTTTKSPNYKSFDPTTVDVAIQDPKEEVVDSLLPSSSSAATRLRPPFSSFISSIRNLWAGDSEIQSDIGSESNGRTHPVLTQRLDGENATSADIVEFGTGVVLGKGDKNDVKFEWLIQTWSECSPVCGGTGFQVRAAHCMVKVNNTTFNVDQNLCEDAGLQAPVTIKKCDTEPCPTWVANEWQSCHESKCFTWNTAMQKREVRCKSANGTVLPETSCEKSEKPTTKQECYNDMCKGTWIVGEWTECHSPCDTNGLKYRILQCVWYGTKKAAGTACRDLPRPNVMRACRGPPCLQNSAVCKDRSRYCRNVKSLNMCRLHRYQTQCCQTCEST